MGAREPAAVEVPATRDATPRALVAASVVSSLAFCALVAVMMSRSPLARGLPWELGAAMAVAVVGMTLVLAVLGTRVRLTPGTLRVEGEALFWNGAPVFARGEVREAIAYTNGPRHGVRVRSRWRTSHFDLNTREEADRIVEALGKDSSQATMSFAGGAGAFAGFTYIGPQLFQLAHGWVGFVLVALGATVLPLTLMLVTRTRWVIGADGLLVRRGFGRRRFVAYPEIAKLAVEGAVLAVVLRDGTQVALTSADDTKETSRPVVGSHALATRIERACARAAERRSTVDVAAALARGDRDVGSWMKSLRELLDRPATYRVAPVPRDHLWTALEDVRQPAEVRAAAAAALQPALAEHEVPRLRVAASACASPRLRVALEAAGAKDEMRLEEALEEIADAGKRMSS